jgi:hypothetical protein
VKCPLGWRRWLRIGGTGCWKSRCTRCTTQTGGGSGRAPRTESAQSHRRSGKAENKQGWGRSHRRGKVDNCDDTPLAATVLGSRNSVRGHRVGKAPLGTVSCPQVHVLKVAGTPILMSFHSPTPHVFTSVLSLFVHSFTKSPTLPAAPFSSSPRADRLYLACPPLVLHCHGVAWQGVGFARRPLP